VTRERVLLHWLALITLSATTFLVFAGGMVTSTGSGLAVPDWPLSFGSLNPSMVGGVFYEHGHRLIAGGVALLTTFLALLAWRVEPRAGVRRLAWAALGLVLAQALLGGLTVLFLLPTAISVAHAATANLFFAVVAALTWLTSSASSSTPAEPEPGRSAPGGWIVLAVVIYGQMLLGALMRHTGAGLAIPDFPLMFGRLIPPLDTWPVAIHFAHRMGALLVILLAIPVLAATLRAAGRAQHLLGPAATMTMLLPLQAALGALTVWTGKAPILTSLHVVGGTLCLGTAVWGALATRHPASRSQVVVDKPSLPAEGLA
jgi:cytochrome c oxidase assembly protein subunit 15